MSAIRADSTAYSAYPKVPPIGSNHSAELFKPNLEIVRVRNPSAKASKLGSMIIGLDVKGVQTGTCSIGSMVFFSWASLALVQGLVEDPLFRILC